LAAHASHNATTVNEIQAAMNKWYDDTERKRDKDEDRTNLDWMTALIVSEELHSHVWTELNEILTQNWSLSHTMYWLTTTVKFAPQIVSLSNAILNPPANTVWTPTLPVAILTDTEIIDLLTATLSNTWIFHNSLIHDPDLIPPFLLDLSFQTDIETERFVEVIHTLDSETPQNQMSVIRYWQAWLYIKQISDNESRTSNTMAFPTPYIQLSDDTNQLLNLQYIHSRVQLSQPSTLLITTSNTKNSQCTDTGNQV